MLPNAKPFESVVDTPDTPNLKDKSTVKCPEGKFRNIDKYDFDRMTVIVNLAHIFGTTAHKIKRWLMKYSEFEILAFVTHPHTGFEIDIIDFSTRGYNIIVPEEIAYTAKMDPRQFEIYTKFFEFNRPIYEKMLPDVRYGSGFLSDEDLVELMSVIKIDKSKGKNALVLGHGPTVKQLDKVDLEDYDLILTCHDDCGIWALHPGFTRFTMVTCDQNTDEIRQGETMSGKGIKCYHLRHISGHTTRQQEYLYSIDSDKFTEANISNQCKCYSGMGAIEFALLSGYENVSSLGLDWTYCDNIQRRAVDDAFTYLFSKYDYNYIKL